MSDQVTGRVRICFHEIISQQTLVKFELYEYQDFDTD